MMKASFRQLEAFYHVMLHQGISSAARACRVDQSTFSEHMAALEAAYATRLFHRAPFRPTRHGRTLFRAVGEALELVKRASDEVCRETRPSLRFMAAEVVTQDFLPGIMQRIERLHPPKVVCSAESGSEEQMMDLLDAGAVDCVIAPEHEGWRRFPRARLIELPLVLVGRRPAAVTTAGSLWARPRLTDKLYVSGASDTVRHCFDTGLDGLGVKWTNRRRVSSALAVVKAVLAGGGYGLCVAVPGLVAHRRLRVLPLPHFAAVPIAVFWRGVPTDVHRTTLQLLQRASRELQRGR